MRPPGALKKSPRSVRSEGRSFLCESDGGIGRRYGFIITHFCALEVLMLQHWMFCPL